MTATTDDGSAEWAYAAVLGLLPRLRPSQLHRLTLDDIRAVQRARLNDVPGSWVPPAGPAARPADDHQPEGPKC